MVYFQTISYLRDLMENLTKIHCTGEKGEVGWWQQTLAFWMVIFEAQRDFNAVGW